MARYHELKSTRRFMGRLKHGADLLEELKTVCVQNGVTLGRVEALGAVRKARVGYYNQTTREYQFIDINLPLEITKLTGNVSQKDGDVMIHAHITLSDDRGNAFGGHLAPGTEIFACEFVLEEFEGPEYRRDYDEETGLPLWQI